MSTSFKKTKKQRGNRKRAEESPPPGGEMAEDSAKLMQFSPSAAAAGNIYLQQILERLEKPKQKKADLEAERRLIQSLPSDSLLPPKPKKNALTVQVEELKRAIRHTSRWRDKLSDPMVRSVRLA